jgi:hypothetical protein
VFIYMLVDTLTSNVVVFFFVFSIEPVNIHKR